MSALTAIILIFVALGVGWSLCAMHAGYKAMNAERKALVNRVAKLEENAVKSERCKLSFQKAESIEELTATQLAITQELEVVQLHIEQLAKRANANLEMSQRLRDNKHQR